MPRDLASIDWAKLSHAYGTAERFPESLRDLQSGSKSDRAKALEWCWENLIHQGARFEASEAAVPFLFDVFGSPGFPLERELIDLTLAIGVGLGDFFLPRGYDLPAEERRLAESSRDRAFLTERELGCYRAVRRRAPTYLRFLGPDRPSETRIAAAFAVAFFAQSLSAAHDEVAGLVEREQDEAVSASLTLCLGMLGKYSDPKPSVDLLRNRLSPERSPTERPVSAIAVTTTLGEETPEAAYRTLLQALTEAWTLPPEVRRLPWNEDDLLGYAALVLRLTGSERREEIARALCSALASGSRETFAIPMTLLDLLFPEPAPAGGRTVAGFDEVQRTSLAVLLRSDQWRSWMIDRRFLPAGLVGEAYAQALCDFVREVTGDEAPLADPVARLGNVPFRDPK